MRGDGEDRGWKMEKSRYRESKWEFVIGRVSGGESKRKDGRKREGNEKGKTKKSKFHEEEKNIPLVISVSI